MLETGLETGGELCWSRRLRTGPGDAGEIGAIRGGESLSDDMMTMLPGELVLDLELGPSPLEAPPPNMPIACWPCAGLRLGALARGRAAAIGVDGGATAGVEIGTGLVIGRVDE